MLEQESELSRYVKWVMNSKYPASSLLNPTEFIKYSGHRGLFLSEDNLEFYDKIGILRPFLRVVTPALDEKNQYHRRNFSDAGIFQLQYFYSVGIIELPRDGDYQKWTDYLKKGTDRCLYYHPYQILQLDQIVTEVTLKTNSVVFDKEIDLIDFQNGIRERLEWKKKSITKWINWIGLLLLLDEHYGPLVKTEVPYNTNDMTSHAERNKKKIELFNKFSPNHILLLSGMKIEDSKNFYQGLSHLAREKDPLRKWFMLQQLVKLSRKYQLTNQALLAQDYYGCLYMLGNFIFDITGKIVPDPDDILDSQKGKWKVRLFGEPFDYTTKKTQNQILKYFLWDRPFELVFVVEGQTEERVIKLILEARGVDLEKDGFFVYNIEGIDNLTQLKPLFRVSQLIDSFIIAMIDNDKEVDKKIIKMKENARELGYSKEIMVRKWNRDFEGENFGMDMVIQCVNQILDENGYNRIDKQGVENRMATTGDALIKSIASEIGRINHNRFEGGKKPYDFISKPRLAELLMQDRLKEIQIADDPNWNPKLPIEVELKKAFKLIPNYL